MTEYLYDSTQAIVLDKDALGGKAYNMAWLSKEGFPVPKWWVLTTEALRSQLEAAGLEDWIKQQVKTLSGDSDSAAVGKVADAIQGKVAKLALTDNLRSLIKEALPESDLEEKYFAVRSSILGEDAEGASFAGQMDSYLYQKGLDAICESVIKVLSSAFNHRALVYRLSKGLPVTDIQAAVIIQEMIDGAVSGVMFTAQPITGSRKHALISATWGCGEGVVSGICNTDEYTVGLFDNKIEKQINEKDIQLVFDKESGRGTKEIPVPDDQQNQPCLSDDRIRELKDTGLAIAEKCKSPQDIEWTIKDNQIYILQTRPVTSLPEFADPNDKLVVWDNSNIQESYCGVTTPLTFSYACRAYMQVYDQTFSLLGSKDMVKSQQDMLANMLGLIRGRVYYNINNWYKSLLFLPSFKTNKSDMEKMMGLQDPVDFVQAKELSFWEKLVQVPKMLVALFKLTSGFRNMHKLVPQFRAGFEENYQRVERGKLHTMTVGEIIELCKDLDKKLVGQWSTPIINDFYVMMMNGRVHRWLESAGFEEPATIQNNLMSGEEGIESTEPTKYLLRLCDQIRTDPELKQTIETTANDKLLDVLQVSYPGLYKQCMEYIELYGDRTMGELKLESITLREDPKFMFAVLKNFLSRDDLTLNTLAENEEKFRNEAEAQAFSAIKSKLGSRKLAKFKKDLTKLREAVKNRENMRLARTRVFGIYRSMFLEIGNQLAFYGFLDNPRDIFYLTIEEIYAFNDGRSVQTVMKPIVAARRAEFEEYEKEDLPHHFWTYGAVYLNNKYEYPNAASEEELAASANSRSLKGTGCYPGIVEKSVRLIFSPEDELSLEGQILCTVRTDPGWAPLFPTAGGIIVERGSTLSHSAVVARELGIPAIVGVPNVTSILKDQEQVRMDGSSGIVERLELEETVEPTEEVQSGEVKENAG